MKKIFDNPKAMDLQLFAVELTPEQEAQLMQLMSEQGAEWNQPTEGTQPIEQSTEGQPAETQSDTQPEDQSSPQNQGTQSPEGEPSQAPQGEKILGKFNSVNDLANAYRNLESFTTQTRQELSETKQMLNQLQAMLQAQQNGTAQPVDGTEGNQDNEFDNEKFMEMFYENPQEAVKQILERVVKPEIEPIKQKIAQEEDYKNWVSRVNEFARRTPDLARWQADMKVILQENPELKNDPKGLDKAYAMAKGLRYQDPNQLLQDEQFVNQNILQNEEIRNKIIQDYLSKLKKGAPPASIGTGPVSGNMPVTPPKRPSNMEEAATMALELFK